MKKLFTLVCAALAAVSVNAQMSIGEGDNIATYMNDAVDAGETNVVIEIEEGATVTMQGSDATGAVTGAKIPDGVSLTVKGLGTGATISMVKSLEIDGSHDLIKFENVSIVEGGSCQYFINEGNESTIGELAFVDCHASGFSRSMVRLKDNAAISIGTVTVEGCTFDNMANGYSLFLWKDAAYTVTTTNITNCTFSNINRSIVEAPSSNCTEINITNCTFYKAPAETSRYVCDCKSNNAAITISNCIFAGSDTRGARTSGTLTTDNIYFTSDFSFNSNAFEPTVQLTVDAAGLFTDPANGDFTLLDNTINAGDPRWITYDPSGIQGVQVEQQADADAPVYNLAGQRVSKDTKGILIQNGKKFVNK